MPEPSPAYSVELLDESGGHCDCCGAVSRTVWGLVHHGERTVAAYWMTWSVGHLNEPGANLDLVLGAWGEDTTAGDRVAVSLLYREPDGAPPAFMVIDAIDRTFAKSDLVAAAMSRAQVMEGPMAGKVFDLVDAIWIQDNRFF